MLMRKTMFIKTVKFVLVVIVCIASIFLLDAMAVGLTHSLINSMRNALPLKGFTSIFCLFFICFVSICIVAFVGGFFHWISLKTIRLASIIYIILNWLIGIKDYTFMSLEVTKHFSFLVPTVMTILYAVLLILALLSSRSLHVGGRKLRAKMRKGPRAEQVITLDGLSAEDKKNNL